MIPNTRNKGPTNNITGFLSSSLHPPPPQSSYKKKTKKMAEMVTFYEDDVFLSFDKLSVPDKEKESCFFDMKCKSYFFHSNIFHKHFKEL
jgi:hypothetical protein